MMNVNKPFYEDKNWIIARNVCLNSGVWPANGLAGGESCECGFKCKISAFYKKDGRTYVLTVNEFLEILPENQSSRLKLENVIELKNEIEKLKKEIENLKIKRQTEDEFRAEIWKAIEGLREFKEQLRNALKQTGLPLEESVIYSEEL
jgi:hypothetical protein